MSQKTIQIDPRYLAASSSGSGTGRQISTGTRRRGRKEKPKAATLVKPDKMKKQWIAKVKEFQKRRQDEESKAEKAEEAKTDIQEFNDEFSKTMTFFEGLSSKRQKAKEQRRSRKKKADAPSVSISGSVGSAPSNMPVSLDLPPEFNIQTPPAVCPTPTSKPASSEGSEPPARPVSVARPVSDAKPVSTIPRTTVRVSPPEKPAAPEAVATTASPPATSNKFPVPALGAQPPYSTLRNGSRPTYRQWRRGQSLKTREPSEIVPSDSATERSIKTARTKLRSTYNNSGTKATPSNRRMKKRITRTIRHRVGRKDGKVGVLIKDAHTRKRVQTEKAHLRRTSIVEIKRFLRSRNLIKAGSSAPNDVLRKMYEQCMLSGDLKNESDEVLLHNFMST